MGVFTKAPTYILFAATPDTDSSLVRSSKKYPPAGIDEPTSGLDPISTAKIEATLVELKNDYTMVLVSNNTKQIARATDRVAFLLMSRIIEIGDTKQVFTVPANQKTDDYISGRFG